MVEENISPEFRLKNLDETRNHFLEEIEQNELISKKHIKVCTTVNYIEHFLKVCATLNYIEHFLKVCTTLNFIEHFLILASTVTECISISAFASLLNIPIEIASSAVD